ncbi:TPA_exp: Arrestin (Or S-antigen), N-terminal domain protein [Trichophyton benhamiae CBS 112371]|nr:TPA_exp: Arrestin (Or S-antigen), N-terminal domain protein [Trichophyton benhamiae CBS 112371]
MAASLASRAAPFEPWTKRSSLRVDITLKDQPASGICSYTTLDAIEGEATFTADVDTRFEQISISFVGTSRTLIERPGAAGPTVGRSSAFHTFLRLVQPIDESDYPEPRILEAGRKYTFPFTFVVPERMLPQSCSHKMNHPQVQLAHTNLPPSAGDPMLAGDGNSLLDDMVPQMVQIQYNVRAKLSKHNPSTGTLRTVIDQGKKVRIIPATDVEPPLDVSENSIDYCLRTEKSVKRGALRGKLGRIAMAAAQPKPFHLPPIHHPGSEDVTTSEEQETPSTLVKVHVRFDPADENQKPPRLSTLWTKLKVFTYYASEPWKDFATRANMPNWSLNHGMYAETVPLETRCIASVPWTKHSGDANSTFCSPASSSSNLAITTPLSSAPNSRRGSVQSTSSIDSSQTGPTAAYAGNTYYTCTILAPITLPKTKAFLPTFHSCLTSRIYALDMSLSVVPPNTSLTVPQLSIRVPVQVAGAESLAQAVALRGDNVQNTDSFFTPRSISPPPAEYTGRASLGVHRRERSDTLESIGSTMTAATIRPPPEYSPFGRQLSHRRVVSSVC